MKGSNPRTVLCHKQNINQKRSLLRKKSDAPEDWTGRAVAQAGETGHRALRAVPGPAFRLVTVTTVQMRPESSKNKAGGDETDAVLKGTGMFVPTEEKTEASVLYKTWAYVRSVLPGN